MFYNYVLNTFKRIFSDMHSTPSSNVRKNGLKNLVNIYIFLMYPDQFFC